MKRGELEINKLVAFALAAIVLLILIFIFSGSARDFVKQITGIGQDIEDQRSGEKCVQGFISQRQCYTQTCAQVQQQETGSRYVERIAPNGTWPDCASPRHCCERLN